ncbi:hypothetical protein ACFQ3X_12180 [Plantactinospora endophytica]|uniref:Uncharacterized protein n=2 Tax=Plantactinospora endophytica TaxID=673535 RepID=A0ABQ4DSN0_9ACTN|nr:hypothetical protein [Plantactinospora endophytica]GIG85112.1 hypothetical protein Pen02_00480 [Plantactinospora endophytica]
MNGLDLVVTQTHRRVVLSDGYLWAWVSGHEPACNRADREPHPPCTEVLVSLSVLCSAAENQP